MRDKDEVRRICIKCERVMAESETVHPKHVPEDKLCPDCCEVTEVVTGAMKKNAGKGAAQAVGVPARGAKGAHVFPSHKPKLKFASLLLLCEVDKYIRQYKLTGRALQEAASDVLDGGATRAELGELIRKRLLSICELDDDGENYRDDESLCGSSWTVDITPRAIVIFWPDDSTVGRAPAGEKRKPSPRKRT